MNKITNKIIMLSLCAVLIIVAMLCGYQPAEYVAGKGKGKNQKVHTIEELSTVTEGVCATLNALNTQDAVMAVQKSPENMDYNSVTMDMTTTLTNKVSGVGIDMYVDMSYSMRYYISADGKMMILMVADICFNFHMIN